MGKVGRKVQEGDIIDVIAPIDLLGGDPIDFGDKIGIASTDALIGELVAMQIEGVFEFDGALTDTFAFGDKVYLDSVGRKEVVVSPTNNKLVGYAVSEKAGAVAGKVRVKLGA
jgi:predicted RecA/RadA family phage recombinase